MSYNIPEDLLYTAEHEWLRKEEKIVVTGITDFAQAKLGEITYIEFVKEEGQRVSQFEEYAIVNTQKSSNSVYSPITGTIVKLNETLLNDPSPIHEDPYGKGWIAKISPENLSDEERNLLDWSRYKRLIEEAERGE